MKIRESFFKYRSYTPIPIILAAIILAETTWISYLIGFLIAASGEIIRIWAVAFAGSATRTTGEVGDTSATLATSRSNGEARVQAKVNKEIEIRSIFRQ